MPYHNPFFLIGTSTAGAALNLAGSGDLYTFTIPCKCRCLRASISLITAISSNADVVVDFDRTPQNAGSREATFVTITIPYLTATTAGNVYFDEPTTEKLLYEGDIVTLQLTTAASSSGTGNAYLTCEYIPETAANNAYMHEV